MSLRTIQVEFKVDARRFVDQIRAIRLCLALAEAARPSLLFSFSKAGTAAGHRRLHRRRLEAAQRLQADDPRIDIQVVTMADGVCRVVVRRLGGWSLPLAPSNSEAIQ